jgi:VWFA-related protein
MTRAVRHFFFVVMTATCTFAQEPVFRSRTDLVTVPVVVTREGHHVRGLKKEDFQLLHNGKPEKIAVFEEVSQRQATGVVPPAEPNTVQNYVPSGSKDVVIIVISASDWYSENNVRSHLNDIAKSLEATQTPTSVLLFVRDTLIQIHSFSSAAIDISKSVNEYLVRNRRWRTTENDLVTPGADTTTDDFPGAYFERARLQDDRMRLDAVSQIAAAYRGIPGRKKLIWMGSGFFSAIPIGGDLSTRRTSRQTSEAEAVSSGIFNTAAMREAAWQRLSDANIAVYPLDLHGTVNPIEEERFAASFSGSGRYGNEFSARRYSNDQTLSMLEVANRTGGKNCTDLPDRCVKNVQADGNEYYVLGFYLPKNAEPGWHELKVQTPLTSASVRARAGFAVARTGSKAQSEVMKETALSINGTSKAAAPPARNEVLIALAAPVDYSSIPLRMNWNVAASDGEARRVELFLTSPAGAVSFDADDGRFDVDLLAFVRPIGKLQGTSYPQSLTKKLTPLEQQRLAAGFAYRKMLNLAAGRYGLRVLLRDNITGKIGTVSAQVVVP